MRRGRDSSCTIKVHDALNLYGLGRTRSTVAERGRFELPVPLGGTAVFKTAAFGRSATSPAHFRFD